MCYFSIIHYNSLYNPIRGIKSEYGFIICLATLRKTLVQFVCFSIVRYFNISKSIVSAVSRSFPTYKKYIYIFIQPQGQFKLYIYAIYNIYIYIFMPYSWAIFSCSFVDHYDWWGGGEGARGAAEEVGREPTAKCGWGAHGDTVAVGCLGVFSMGKSMGKSMGNPI